MSGTILQLVPKPTLEPSLEAIALLEGFIERIKAGEVVAVAVAARGLYDQMHTGWYGWSGELIGPASVLNARLIADARKE